MPKHVNELLTYCRLNNGRVHFVVVFNLTRFARDPPFHCLTRCRWHSAYHSLLLALPKTRRPLIGQREAFGMH